MSFWSALGTAVLGGLASKYESKQQAGMTKEQIEAQGKEARKSTEFEMTLADWFKQRDRAEKRSGANNYAQFNNLASFLPAYRSTNQPTPMPTKPVAGKGGY